MNTNQKRTTDDTDTTGLGSAPASRERFIAPLKRSSIWLRSTRSSRRVFESGKRESTKWNTSFLRSCFPD